MNSDIPNFEDMENRFVDGAPIVKRDMVLSIVYNPKTDEVLCLKWNAFDWKTLVTGGIDPGEDAVTAGMREIKEETGYTNVKFLGECGKAKSSFYAANKKENRISNATGLVFELISGDKIDTNDEEKEKHLPFWIPRSEVASYVNIDWQLYLFERAIASGLLAKLL